MRNGLRMVSLACLVVLVSNSAALAKENWLGTWTLNVAASKFSPGPAPKSETLKFEAVKGGTRLTSNTVEADGKTETGQYVTKYDGKEVPWKGNKDADTAT